MEFNKSVFFRFNNIIDHLNPCLSNWEPRRSGSVWNLLYSYIHVFNPGLHLCRQPPPNTRRSMAWIGTHSLQKASLRYMGILYVITHPDFKASHNGYVNDLALVRLKKKITFSKDVAPVRLPHPTDTFSTSSSCWIIGWGDVGTDGTSSASAGSHRCRRLFILLTRCFMSFQFRCRILKPSSSCSFPSSPRMCARRSTPR